MSGTLFPKDPYEQAVRSLGQDAYNTAKAAIARSNLPSEEKRKCLALSFMFIRSLDRDGLEGLQAIEHAIDLCHVAGDRSSIIAIVCSLLWRQKSRQVGAVEKDVWMLVRDFLGGHLAPHGEVVADHINRKDFKRRECVCFLAVVGGIPLPPGYTDLIRAP